MPWLLGGPWGPPGPMLPWGRPCILGFMLGIPGPPCWCGLPDS